MTTVLDEIVLEGHLGTNGLILVETNGAVETLTPSTGSPVTRICTRNSVLLKRNSRDRF